MKKMSPEEAEKDERFKPAFDIMKKITEISGDKKN